MNLLKYTVTPIKYDLNITPAALKIQQELPRVNVTRQGGDLSIHQEQVQVRLDTFERRSSMGLKGMPDFMADAAQRGQQAAMEATRTYADFGNQILNIQNGANIPDAMFSKMMAHSQGDLVLVPLSSTDISWVPGSVEMNYNAVNLDFNWNTGIGKANMEFVPGDVNLNVTQYPEIHFEYLGGPIYVPPSADPNYVAAG